MDRTEQQKTDETPVVSPLAQDKTYGERWYSGIFDWGLNYWTNLTTSAAFSQWAEHGTRPVKLMGNKSPREWQRNIADWVEKKDPFMNGKIPFTSIDNPIPGMGGFKKKMMSSELSVAEKEFAIFERSMARARSLILLIPGFAVVIPTVWIGAKVKPWFVQTLNKMHYGDDAMSDPSMIARQQAIESESRPTLLGTVMARLGTVAAAQATAQIIGSEHNVLNKIGEKHDIKLLKKFGVDPITESAGTWMGSKLPQKMQTGYSRFGQSHGLAASEKQLKDHLVSKNMMKPTDIDIPDRLRKIAENDLKEYTTATQDIGRFIAADTFYTAVTAVTIQPIIKLLRLIPGMSYKPKMPQDAARFDGERVTVPKKIKVPANQYADESDIRVADTTIDTPALDRAETDTTPTTKLSSVNPQGTLQDRVQQLA